jgi:hypothetical protein
MVLARALGFISNQTKRTRAPGLRFGSMKLRTGNRWEDRPRYGGKLNWASGEEQGVIWYIGPKFGMDGRKNDAETEKRIME